MILIYFQSTIDCLYKANVEAANIKFLQIESEYGKPESKDLVAKNGDVIRYYKFEIEEKKQTKRKK